MVVKGSGLLAPRLAYIHFAYFTNGRAEFHFKRPRPLFS
jgi:hypothetical protein